MLTKTKTISLKHLPMPLTSAQTVFDTSAWIGVFNYIAQIAEERKSVSDHQKKVTVHIRDLYFSKFFNEGEFNLRTAENDFARVAHVERWERTNNDREDETGLRVGLGIGQRLRCYEFRRQGCLAIGDAVASDCSHAKQWLKLIQKPRVKWIFDPQDFLHVIEVIEKNFRGRGETCRCRIALDVWFAGAKISVRQFSLDTESWAINLNGNWPMDDSASVFKNSLKVAA